MIELEFRSWDNKAKAMFPVHEMKFDKINNQLQHISGVDIYDKDSDFNGDVYYGGNIHKKTGKPGEPLQPKFILLQYTGLKDTNATKIFEGDIVKCFYPERNGLTHTLLGPVDFIDGCWFITEPKRNYSSLLYSEFASIEVIGNIHQNKELLEEN